MCPLPDTPGSTTTGDVPGPPDRAATDADQIGPDVDDGPPSTTDIPDTNSLLRARPGLHSAVPHQGAAFS